MQASELQAFQKQLEELVTQLRSEIAEEDDQAATVTLDQSRVGRLSRMDALQGQQMALEARRRRERQLKAALVALRKIESGDFGECDACGEPINPKRLAFDPTVTLCIDCA
ncbi:transcriptional regulator, TraR/DksA family [Marinospirillum celere]|uniref:Transcriptional regulator, TraR/DksA family n=1 Tax=Marinospirillum celere TaxID=1122252 RepID=A0A1I1HBS3_9GAMM|nr:TraR/DksA family transcriptional regulator [Marinospirillum celere]SFC21236.1 transcriptional regulator, TraR/DksA family [Marinospirillum celere]